MSFSLTVSGYVINLGLGEAISSPPPLRQLPAAARWLQLPKLNYKSLISKKL